MTKHGTDAHIECVSYANSSTVNRFNVHGPYEPGTEEHKHWLQAYDYCSKHVVFASDNPAAGGDGLDGTTGIIDYNS